MELFKRSFDEAPLRLASSAPLPVGEASYKLTLVKKLTEEFYFFLPKYAAFISGFSNNSLPLPVIVMRPVSST